MRGLCLAAAAATLALAACGAEDGGGDEEPADADDAIPVPWLRAQPAAGGAVLRLGYVNDPCTRARRARVEAGEGEIAVTLLDDERDPEQACVALAEPGCAELRLAEPLAGRRLVDGARGAPPERGEGADGPFRRFEPCRSVPVAD